MCARAVLISAIVIGMYGCGTGGMVSNALNGEPIIGESVWLPHGVSGESAAPLAEKADDPADEDYLPPACRPAAASNADNGANKTNAAAPKPAGDAEKTAAAPKPEDANKAAGKPNEAAPKPAGDADKTAAKADGAPPQPTRTASLDPYSGWSTTQINNCAYAMKELIDLRFARYEDALSATNSTWNVASDAGIIALNAAGALTAQTTSQILHAASGGLAGLQGKINSDVLYSHSINIILQQMRSDRLSQAIVIEAKIQNNKYKNMYDAATDLYAYARAGSWTEALLSVEGSTASEAADCKTQEKKNQLTAAQSGQQPNTGTNATTTASNKCPETGTTVLKLDDPATVKKIQTALNNALNPKPALKVDGIFGPKTLKALNAFQTSKHLSLTAAGAPSLDSDTAIALGLQPNPQSPPAD